MNKVAILTLNGYFNYGNRLQNYALQEAIYILNFECETIRNTTNLSICGNEERQSSIRIFLEKGFLGKIEMIKGKINSKKIRQLNRSRTELFENFSKKYIYETDFTISLNNIPKNLNEKYKYFIAGSDQVWNPNDPMVSEINFMTFAPKHKRLTYAPSFGVTNIPEKYKRDYAKWLDEIENISVREQEGANIIKQLTGKNSQVVIDPTMLHTKEKWMSIAKEDINKPQAKYLLTYFLGGIPKDINSTIRKISKENRLEIVNLATLNDKKHYVTGPSEFIDYINDASLFITDSFHGCVFSVLLETPFIVCDRLGHTNEQNMGSRIETFLNKFELQSRRFNNVKGEKIFSCDYRKSNKILEVEREKAWNYLKKALNSNE